MRAHLLLLPLLAGCATYDYVGGDIAVVHIKRAAPGVGRAFRRLVAAVTAAPMSAPDAAALGASEASIRAAALTQGPAAPLALQHFADEATSRESLVRYARWSCQGTQSTARPKFRVRIWTWRGLITLQSESDNALEIPWTVTRGRTSFTTCNPEIHRALSALFPGTLHDDRMLVDEIIVDALGMYGGELETNRAAEWLGAQLAPIRRRLPVGSMSIHEKGKFCDSTWSDRSHPATLTVMLAPPELGRVQLRLELAVREARIDPQPFVAAFDRVAGRVNALKWLHSYLEAHPLATAIVEVDGNASSEATFGLQLRDGEQHFESWRVEADGRGRLESPGEILVLKAIYGDWLTAEGELQLGPGHR